MNRKILVIAAGATVLIVVAALVGRALGGGSHPRFPSLFSSHQEGLMGFGRLLERLGRPVESRTRPWDDLAAARASGVLLVATPLQRPVDAREADAIRRWLVRGGALIVIDDATTLEGSPRLEGLLVEADLGAESPLPDIDPGSLTIARPRTRASRGTPARPAGTDLKRITLHAEGGLRTESVAVPLALGSGGAILAAEGFMGSGRIVRVQGPLLANDLMLTGDNLTFALRLVDDLRGEGSIIFDEYHHGFGGLLPSVRGLDPASLAWAGLQALLVGLLYALSRGVRFGPARLISEKKRRSSLEFVRSMASLYRTAAARRHVIESALVRFLREARVHWGLADALTLDSVGRFAAIRSPGTSPERIASSLDAAQEALFKDNLGDREMLARVRDLGKLEEEVFGGR